MTAPTIGLRPAKGEHRLTITLPDGKTARATVTYVQPKAERWRPQTATVHVTCNEWLEPFWHDATYMAGEHSFRGQYLPQSYELQPHGYHYVGTFERAG